MQLGLGLYARMLTTDNLRFARQIGAEAIVVHMADYRTGAPTHSHFDADAKMRDVSGARGKIWTVDELRAIREMVEQEGMKLAALENLNPALWYDVLLDGPQRDQQMAGLKQLIRNMAAAGIYCLGYNFTLAGVWGTRRGNFARGGASGVRFDAADALASEPIPAGAVWNRVYDPELRGGSVGEISRPEFLKRHERFLTELLPVAEECGVTLAAHPDDPPVERLRQTPRFMHREQHIFEYVESFASDGAKLELCIGTIAEMAGADVYRVVERLAAQDKIGYIHFRNVRGTVPQYEESFLDDGDVDMPRLIEILLRHDYQGVLIPDHSPYLTCDAPWHSGMAFALGYMRGVLQSAQKFASKETSCAGN